MNSLEMLSKSFFLFFRNRKQHDTCSLGIVLHDSIDYVLATQRHSPRLETP